MLDYSEQEYQALHAVFPGTQKFLYAFHMEQAWLHWSKESKLTQPYTKLLVLFFLKVFSKAAQQEVPSLIPGQCTCVMSLCKALIISLPTKLVKRGHNTVTVHLFICLLVHLSLCMFTR